MSVRIFWAVGAMRPITTCYVLKTSTKLGQESGIWGVKEDGKSESFLEGSYLFEKLDERKRYT